MKLSSTAGMQGIGWASETFVGIPTADVAKGELVQCDLETLEPDDDQGVALVSGAGAGIYAIALEAVDADKRGQFCLRGKVEALNNSGSELAAGDLLSVDATNDCVGAVDTTAGNVTLGFAVDTISDEASGTILFDGWCPQATSTGA